MAITKIHPIKSTLNLAIVYITNEEKTDEKILVSTNKCFASTAHTAFMKTREDNKVNGTVLARHLIQSFMPGEATPEIAHQIGMELCKRILKDQYEFVLTTHIDKGHIHNHIIFNNVNMVTGKCYQSNKRSYHQIRAIKQSKDWDDFIKRMAALNYETKYGKHIAFKHKDKGRFTRAKTIGEDYTEDRLKERILDNANQRTYTVKKRVGNIIDIENNEKIKSSKGYEYWATKHNLKTAADTVLLMREKGFKSISQLDEYIKESALKRQDLQDQIKVVDNKISTLSNIMEQVHTVKLYRQIYLEYKKDPFDKAFFEEHKSEITLYENALLDLKKYYSKLPNSKDILKELDSLHEKKNTLMQEYSSSKSDMKELYQIRKNYEKYMGKEIER